MFSRRLLLFFNDENYALFFLELFKSTKYIWEEHTRRTYTRTYTYLLLTVLTRIKMEHVQVFFSISKWPEAHLRTVPLRNQNSRLTHHISVRHSRVIHVALSVKKQYEKNIYVSFKCHSVCFSEHKSQQEQEEI